jgi:ribosomal protein S18 acetylase RimI-like enzyme
MANMPDLSLFQALTSGNLVGFKAVYAVTENRYYSWLGGVHPDFLRRGIATLLMQEQHEWLRQSAYDVEETHVRQDNSAMIALNLKYGFDITGMFMKAAEPNYIMQLKVKE